MAQPRVMSYSRTYPIAVARAFDDVLPMSLDTLFDSRYGPIPSVRAVDAQDGVWNTVGQTRIVRLSGGGSMREELTLVDRPNAFGYLLSDVTGPMSPLADRVEGLWSFGPAGTGTRITWQWTVHPATAVAGPLLRVFATLWRGYARQSLQHLEDLLLPA